MVIVMHLSLVRHKSAALVVSVLRADSAAAAATGRAGWGRRVGRISRKREWWGE